LSKETGLQPGTAYPILLRLEHEGRVASRCQQQLPARQLPFDHSPVTAYREHDASGGLAGEVTGAAALREPHGGRILQFGDGQRGPVLPSRARR